jgi:hypothetical protein
MGPWESAMLHDIEPSAELARAELARLLRKDAVETLTLTRIPDDPSAPPRDARWRERRRDVLDAFASTRALRSLRVARVSDDVVDGGGLGASIPPCLEELDVDVADGGAATLAIARSLARDAPPSLWRVTLRGAAVGVAGALAMDDALSRRRREGRALFLRLGLTDREGEKTLKGVIVRRVLERWQQRRERERDDSSSCSGSVDAAMATMATTTTRDDEELKLSADAPFGGGDDDDRREREEEGTDLHDMFLGWSPRRLAREVASYMAQSEVFAHEIQRDDADATTDDLDDPDDRCARAEEEEEDARCAAMVCARCVQGDKKLVFHPYCPVSSTFDRVPFQQMTGELFLYGGMALIMQPLWFSRDAPRARGVGRRRAMDAAPSEGGPRAQGARGARARARAVLPSRVAAIAGRREEGVRREAAAARRVAR